MCDCLLYLHRLHHFTLPIFPALLYRATLYSILSYFLLHKYTAFINFSQMNAVLANAQSFLYLSTRSTPLPHIIRRWLLLCVIFRITPSVLLPLKQQRSPATAMSRVNKEPSLPRLAQQANSPKTVSQQVQPWDKESKRFDSQGKTLPFATGIGGHIQSFG